MPFSFRSLLQPFKSGQPKRRRIKPTSTIETCEERALLSGASLAFASGFEATANIESVDIAVNGNNEVFSVGTFHTTVDFDPGANQVQISSAGTGEDTYLSKLNADGTFAAVAAISSDGSVSASTMAIDDIGNVLVAGHFVGSTDFDPGAGTHSITGRAQDAFVAKYDSDLNFVWAKRFAGSGSISANAIDVDRFGNVFLGGSFRNTIDFNPDTNVKSRRVSGGAEDIRGEADTEWRPAASNSVCWFGIGDERCSRYRC